MRSGITSAGVRLFLVLVSGCSGGTAPWPPILSEMTCPDGSRWMGKPCGSEPAPSPPQPPRAAPPKRPAPPGGAIVWEQLFGPSLNAAGLAVASDGAMLVVGSFTAHATFGGLPALVSEGGSDAFVLKLDPAGEPVWAKRYGGSGPDGAQSVVIDTRGAAYVSGNFESPSIDLGKGPMRCAGIEDLFLTKLDEDGAVLWAKRYGDPLTQIDLRLRPDPEGGVVATGWHNGKVDFGTGPLQKPWSKAFFVARVGPDGEGRFGASFGRRLDYAGTDSAVDPSGRLYVSAGSDRTADLAEPSGHAGINLGPVLFAFDRDGKKVFARRFGHGADNLTTAVVASPDGHVRLVSASAGTTRFGDTERAPTGGEASLTVTSFDGEGHVLWSKELLSGPMVSVSDAKGDAAGNTYVVGQAGERLAFGSRSNGFVVKVTPSGEVAWTKTIADGARAWISAVDLDPAGRITVAGSVTGVDGKNRLYLAKLQP